MVGVTSARHVVGAAHYKVLAVLLLQAADHILCAVRAAVVHYNDLEVLAAVEDTLQRVSVAA